MRRVPRTILSPVATCRIRRPASLVPNLAGSHHNLFGPIP
jgi:hypothetical protein